MYRHIIIVSDWISPYNMPLGIQLHKFVVDTQIHVFSIYRDICAVFSQLESPSQTSFSVERVQKAIV